MLIHEINKKYLVFGGLLTVLLIVVGLCAWSIRETPPPPSTSKPTIPTKAHAAPNPTTAKQPESVMPSEKVTPVAGNLGDLTALRAELDRTKLEVAIIQEKEKLSPKQPPAALKSIPASAPEPVKPAPKLPQAQTSNTPPIVLSIQAVDGRATAIIRIHGQLQTVRIGDQVGSGIVSKVNREGVFIRTGKQTMLLGIEE